MKNSKTAYDLSIELEEAEYGLGGEYICMCNNCMTILFDENPDPYQKRYDIYGLEVLHMGYGNSFEWVCPICKTDEYLTDIQ